MNTIAPITPAPLWTTTVETIVASNSSALFKHANDVDPVLNLFNSLLTLSVAMVIGWCVVRMKIIDPAQGHMVALSWVVGKVAFPAIIFQVTATGKMGSLEQGTLLASNLGPIGMWIFLTPLVYFTFGTDRPVGDRIISATVFGMFPLNANEFAIGLPVVDALFGSDGGYAVYLAANCVIGCVIAFPAICTLLTLGASMQKASLEQEQKSLLNARFVLGIFKELLMEPMILATIAGVLFKQLFGNTMTENAEGEMQLPEPLRAIVKLITDPYSMCSLFMLGAALRKPRFTRWAFLLALLKVVLLPFITGALGDWLSSGENKQQLVDYNFIWGAIPCSPTPLVLADSFDPENSELIATAVLLTLLIGSPMICMSSLAIQSQHQFNVLLRTIMLELSSISCVVGVIVLVVFGILTVHAKLHKYWSQQIILAYIVVTMLTSVIYVCLIIKIDWWNDDASVCRAYIHNDYHLNDAVAWLAHVPTLLLLGFLYLNQRFFRDARKHRLAGIGIILASFAVAIIPAFFTENFFFNTMCRASPALSKEREVSVSFAIYWNWFLVALSIGLMCITPYSAYVEPVDASDDESQEEEQDETEDDEAEDLRQPERVAQNGSDLIAQTESGKNTNSDYVWQRGVHVPGLVVKVLLTFVCFDQFIMFATLHMSYFDKEHHAASPKIQSVMSFLQVLMMNSHLVIVLLAHLACEGFPAHVVEAFKALCPCLMRTRATLEADNGYPIRIIAATPFVSESTIREHPVRARGRAHTNPSQWSGRSRMDGLDEDDEEEVCGTETQSSRMRAHTSTA